MTNKNIKPKLSLVDNADQSPNAQYKRDGDAVRMQNFSAYYGDNSIISDINIELPSKGVSCLVGPSGAGKSTLLRWLNRINEETENASFTGDIEILGLDIMRGYPDVTALRRRVGMVFQQPCVFPNSIYNNMLMGLPKRQHSKSESRDIVQHSLKSAAIWDEIKHRLEDPATSLSLGQQQRLCIARALVLKPDILLLDEPTASIDPVSSRAIEELVIELGKNIAVIMVTHNIGQAKRVADHVIFMCNGKLVEQGPKSHMFSMRSSEKTRTYITEEYCDC